MLLGLGVTGASGVLAAPLALNLPAVEANVDAAILVGELEGAPAYRDEATGLPVTVVSAGSSVRWFWDGAQTHTVTSGLASATGPDGEFDSGERHALNEPENGGSSAPFVVTFQDTGVYKYYCQVHQAQHGILIVV
jgi:plastocyanin